MREIKFRAWDKKRNEMVYFDLDLCNQESRVWFNEQIAGNDIMQFIGIYDKNGVEIYEKDFLYQYPGFSCEWVKRIGFVEYGGASFWITFGKQSIILDDHDCLLEVIGNIHESPELLKV